MKLYRIWMPIDGVNNQETTPSIFYNCRRPVPLFGKLEIVVNKEQCKLTLDGKSITREELGKQMLQKDQTSKFVLWGIVSGEVTMRGDNPDLDDWRDEDLSFTEPSSDRDLRVEFILVASEIDFYEDPTRVDLRALHRSTAHD